MNRIVYVRIQSHQIKFFCWPHRKRLRKSCQLGCCFPGDWIIKLFSLENWTRKMTAKSITQLFLALIGICEYFFFSIKTFSSLFLVGAFFFGFNTQVCPGFVIKRSHKRPEVNRVCLVCVCVDVCLSFPCVCVCPLACCCSPPVALFFLILVFHFTILFCSNLDLVGCI